MKKYIKKLTNKALLGVSNNKAVQKVSNHPEVKIVKGLYGKKSIRYSMAFGITVFAGIIWFGWDYYKHKKGGR